MLKVFYGANRVKAQQEIQKILGLDYEIIEGAELGFKDLPNIFQGVSLFAADRNILIRDLFANKPVAEELTKYLNTSHKIIILELKLDKRSTAYKELKDKIEFREFPLPRDLNSGLVFDIYHTAKHDGKKAITTLEQVKPTQEPMLFFGLMVSQAIKDYQARPQGAKERKTLKELSHLDMLLKSESKLQPWVLIEAFLLRLKTI